MTKGLFLPMIRGQLKHPQLELLPEKALIILRAIMEMKSITTANAVYFNSLFDNMSIKPRTN